MSATIDIRIRRDKITGFWVVNDKYVIKKDPVNSLLDKYFGTGYGEINCSFKYTSLKQWRMACFSDDVDLIRCEDGYMVYAFLVLIGTSADSEFVCGEKLKEKYLWDKLCKDIMSDLN